MESLPPCSPAVPETLLNPAPCNRQGEAPAGFVDSAVMHDDSTARIQLPTDRLGSTAPVRQAADLARRAALRTNRCGSWQNRGSHPRGLRGRDGSIRSACGTAVRRDRLRRARRPPHGSAFRSRKRHGPTTKPWDVTAQLPAPASPRDARQRFERQYISTVLEEYGWRMTEAARVLGIERANLYRKHVNSVSPG